MTLGDKIRALCVPNALLCSAALDRAAELAEAHESALVAGVVKVKPLEWEAGDCDGWFAVDRIAGYVPHFTTEGGIASYEAARAARILSAIEPDLARLNALIAAAYEDAAQRAEDRGAATTADAIRARVPADAQAALDRIKAEAHRAGMREAAGMVSQLADEQLSVAKAQHKNGIDYSATEWAARQLRLASQDILAAAEKEKQNG